MRHQFGWDLPPGVSVKDIEDAQGDEVVYRENITLDGCPITPWPWIVRAATFCDDGIPSFEVVMPGDPHMSAVDSRLIQASPNMYDALKKIYFDNEGECGCECDMETCCNRVGEPCAKCDAYTALVLVNIPG